MLDVKHNNLAEPYRPDCVVFETEAQPPHFTASISESERKIDNKITIFTNMKQIKLMKSV